MNRGSPFFPYEQSEEGSKSAFLYAQRLFGSPPTVMTGRKRTRSTWTSVLPPGKVVSSKDFDVVMLPAASLFGAPLELAEQVQHLALAAVEHPPEQARDLAARRRLGGGSAAARRRLAAWRRLGSAQLGGKRVDGARLAACRSMASGSAARGSAMRGSAASRLDGAWHDGTRLDGVRRGDGLAVARQRAAWRRTGRWHAAQRRLGGGSAAARWRLGVYTRSHSAHNTQRPSQNLQLWTPCATPPHRT